MTALGRSLAATSQLVLTLCDPDGSHAKRGKSGANVNLKQEKTTKFAQGMDGFRVSYRVPLGGVRDPVKKLRIGDYNAS